MMTMLARILVVVSLLLAALGGYTVGRAQDDQPAQKPDSGELKPYLDQYNSSVKVTSALALAKKAEDLGYEAKIIPTDLGGLELQFVKLGKTEEGHGLLGKKWDQKDTINLLYSPDGGGDYKLASAKRVIEERAPIGGWKKLSESIVLPEALLVPELKSERK
jgi:hypothetical protein